MNNPDPARNDARFVGVSTAVAYNVNTQGQAIRSGDARDRWIVLAAVTDIPNESGLKDAFLRPDRT